MIVKKMPPTTKQQLIASLHQSKIQKLTVLEPRTKKDITAITTTLKTYVGDGTAQTTVIVLRETPE
jgi:hypothetical protein